MKNEQRRIARDAGRLAENWEETLKRVEGFIEALGKSLIVQPVLTASAT